MKILLLNDNPVVNKLVTLSAQKTSDELEVVSSIDDINPKSCDLLVLDDTLYSDDGWEEIQEKIKFKKSLYICAKNGVEVSGFTATLKKPFLPTELVELFSTLSKGLDSTDLGEKQKAPQTKSLHPLNDLEEDKFSLDDELESLDYLDNLDDLRDDELINLEHLGELEDLEEGETSLDDALTDLEEEAIEKLDEEPLVKEDEKPSVLDKDELQEVQELLDEAAEDLELEEISGNDSSEYDTDLDDLEEFDLEEKLPESLPLDSELEDLLGELEEDDKGMKGLEELEDFADLSDELELDEMEISTPSKKDEVADLDDFDELDELELEEMEISTPSKNSEVADIDELDDLDFEETEISTPSKEDEIANLDALDELDELEFEEPESSSPSKDNADLSIDEDEFDLEEDSFEDELELEDQIQDAVEKLSDEDLESELDEDSLLDIVGDDMSSLNSLTSRDLKLAMGEAVEELEEEPLEEIQMSSSHEDEIAEVEEVGVKESSTGENEGVESLKKLLAALSNHDVAASLKGMKISINITLGEK